MKSFCITIILIGFFTAIGAQPGNPQWEKFQKQKRVQELLAAKNNPPEDLYMHPELTAVVIIGRDGSGIKEFIQEQRECTAYMKLCGIKVYEFFSPLDSWNAIVKVASKADILIYAGHGHVENNKSYGFTLTKGSTGETPIREKIKFKNNALIIYSHVCTGAGSSAGDNGDIGIQEAIRRVKINSQLQFDIGASAYFACNYYGAPKMIVKEFLKENTIKTIYDLLIKRYVSGFRLGTKNTSFHITSISIDSIQNITVCQESPLPNCKSYSTTTINGVSKSEILPCVMSYDIAYRGNPEFSISFIKKGESLLIGPIDEIAHLK